MNSQSALKIAKRMVKLKCPAYSGKYRIAEVLGVEPKKITLTSEMKVLKQFHMLVAEDNNYPAIEQLYAQEQLK